MIYYRYRYQFKQHIFLNDDKKIQVGAGPVGGIGLLDPDP
jgi:hypothetical protein